MAITQTLIERLATFDTPSICNAIELFEVRPRHIGYTDGRVQAAFPEMPPTVGAACTAKFRSGVPNSSRDPYGQVEVLCQQLEEAIVPTVVVYEDLDDPPVGATFGEVMCGVYKALGAAGLITSGAGRDLAQIRALGFPVFVGSTLCSHACCHAVDVGGVVTIGGLDVRRHDLVHADSNGVATIPHEVVDELPDVATEYLKCESLLTSFTSTNERKRAADIMARRREMAAAIAKLRQRVSRRTFGSD